MSSRKEEQASLLIQFGELVAPLEDLVNYPEQQTPQTRAKASAKFTHDRNKFQNSLSSFTSGEPGHNYKVELLQISAALNNFTSRMASFRDNTDELVKRLKHIRDVATRNVLAIPCELDSAVLEAGSPFSAYVKLLSLIHI